VCGLNKRKGKNRFVPRGERDGGLAGIKNYKGKSISQSGISKVIFENNREIKTGN